MDSTIQHKIELQNQTNENHTPHRFIIQRWVNHVLQQQSEKTELCIRIVNEKEITQLNTTYRKKNKPTNVLSFPYAIPDDVKLDRRILGDIVMCAPIINKEAEEQGKTYEAHWAHLLIHSILHLLGYDHINKKDAVVMEKQEITFLHELGFDNPYEVLTQND